MFSVEELYHSILFEEGEKLGNDRIKTNMLNSSKYFRMSTSMPGQSGTITKYISLF